MSKLNVVLKIKIITTNKNKSLVLLNEYALKAAFKVPTREDQKLIKKNEVSPISSQPRNNVIKLPDETKKTILMINKFRNNINLSTKGSYLKYEKVYIYTNTAIVNVRKEKLTDTISIKKPKDTL